MSDHNVSRSTKQSATIGGKASVDECSINEVSTIANRVIENVEQVIVGKREEIEDILVAIFARGHVLIEDVPGTGKTMLARSLAMSLGGTFKRVQFTPDLLPSDITGINVYNQQSQEFEFQPGPIFANIVLGDEINRAPPKTQSALLEVMEEEQVTVDGETRRVPLPFVVIATQNAAEQSRTYDLPLAEIDRFMKQLHLGYPGEHEPDMLARIVEQHPIDTIEPVTSMEALRAVRERVAAVTVREPIRTYTSDIAGYTREHASLGISPRGTISLVRAAQARAAVLGRDYVIPDDVQREAITVLPHRIQLSTDHGEVTPQEVVENALRTVPIP